MINLLCAFTYMLCTKLHASSSKHSFHDYGVCSKLLKVHKMWKITSLFLSKSHAFWGFKMHSIYSRECERGGFTFKNIFPIWSFDISQLEIENPEFQSMIRSRERINKCILKQIFNPTSKNSISYFTANCGLTPHKTFQWLLLLFWRYKKLDSISGGKQCHV